MEEKKESGKHDHVHHESHEHIEHSSSKRKNDWKILSGILAVVIIILLAIIIYGKMNGGVSGDVAGKKIVDFLNEKTGGGVEYVSAADKGNMYEVTVSYQGQEIPVYVTKDGQYFVQSPIPITDTNSTEGSQTAAPTEVPKTAKPVVELFVMSYCPYGTMAEKGIIPAIEALGSKIDFKLRFVNYAMHDKKEIDENTIDYCIQKEQSAKLLPYLKCFLKEGKSEACLTEVGIDNAKLKSCIAAADTQFKITANYNDKSTYQGQFPPYDVDKTLNTKYGVQGSPTLVINGVQLNAGRDSASYLKGICAAFTTAPAECQKQLSSESPSPGFGYTTTGTAASGTAATCG